MSNTTSTSSANAYGIGFGGLLTIAFVVLKLTGYIAWSWWAVTSPLWAPPVLILAVVVIWGAIYVAIVHASSAERQKERDEQRVAISRAAAKMRK